MNHVFRKIVRNKTDIERHAKTMDKREGIKKVPVIGTGTFWIVMFFSSNRIRIRLPQGPV